MAKSFIRLFGTKEQKEKIRISEQNVKLLGIGIDPNKPGFISPKRVGIEEALGFKKGSLIGEINESDLPEEFTKPVRDFGLNVQGAISAGTLRGRNRI